MDLELNKALPDRYEVGRRGTPDPPNSAYVVLNHATDTEARITLRSHIRLLRMTGRKEEAEQIEAALQESAETFRTFIEERNPKPTKTRRRR